MFTTTIKHCGYVAAAICEHWSFKVVFGVLAGMFSFLFDVDMQIPMVSVVVLVIFDFITAIMAAHRTGEEIRSSKAFRSAVKLFVYGMLVSAGNLIGNNVIPFGAMDDIILGFIALTEIISLMENAGRLGYAVPKKLLNKLEEMRDEQ